MGHESCFPRTEVILSDKENIAEMCGETLREAGTLVIVFAPLYQLFEPTKRRWEIFLAIVIA